MRRRFLSPTLLPAIAAAALLLSACEAPAGVEGPGATSAARAETTPSTASEDAPEGPDGAATAQAPAEPTASATPPAALYILITNTDGQGVAVRDACDDEARVSVPGEGIRDGSFVEFLQGGGDECDGWMYIRDLDGRRSWVRAHYLGPAPGEPPGTAAAPDPPGAAPSPEPTARRGRFAQFYGLAPPGIIITAWIDGSECAATTANARGEWLLQVYQRECDGKAVGGATVSFTVNGVRANETVEWRPGGGPDDPAHGITLTIAYEPE